MTTITTTATPGHRETPLAELAPRTADAIETESQLPRVLPGASPGPGITRFTPYTTPPPMWQPYIEEERRF